MTTTTEFIHASLKLEGQRFLIEKELDRCVCTYEYGRLKNKILYINNQIEQYQKTMDALRSIKRRMRR